MHVRYPYLFALALTLPLASCRFVGMKPDFTVVGDTLTPPEPDHVYVESQPRKTTPIAAASSAPAQPASYAAPAPAGSNAPLFAQQQPAAAPTPAPAPASSDSLFSQQQLSQKVSQVQTYVQPSYTPGSAQDPPRTYTVRSGDSLSRIARLYQVPVGSLAAANGIDLASAIIKPGQQLLIPQGGAAITAPPRSVSQPTPQPKPAQPATAPAAPPAVTPAAPAAPSITPLASTTARGQYRVNPGDTLYRIARMHGISLQELMQANNISPENAHRVRVGTLLSIPTKK